MKDRTRPITESEIATYESDGVVYLRAVLPRPWIERMRDATEALLRDGERMADMTAMAREIEAHGGRPLRDEAAPGGGRFLGGTDHWRTRPDFRAFAADSPLPAVAAALMRSSAVYLYEDSLLVKEPGAAEPTAFHQDLSYFHVEGERICTFWCPLDPTRLETGTVCYVRGSHRWGRLFRPNLFVSEDVIPGSRGDPVPDVRARSGEFEVVHFEMEPGDVAVHHACTLHGAGGNRSASTRRRAISVRYCGDDARHFLREGAPRKPHHRHLSDGDPLGGADCPRVWPR